ncbi:NAD(P)-binding protein [Zopfia rhizophila CBS 207.26]|uniref:NAD(P)-binding protein n=1 Tax=Zopfia rhizophila CBS 207.26 TaxID=1314779 RepID=A0A6A6ENZ3_9PEZI|nr:NAD(P)-binding protein [Zopfia rhizophila CBS 207.26]
MDSKIAHDSAMPKDDLSTTPYLAKPSGVCCLEGNIHSGNPRGSFVTISDVETYIVKPPEGKANGHILLYFPDIWGMFPNGLLIMDGFADSGYLVLGLDYFRGNPVWKHRKNRHDKTTEPNFDYEAWKKKHTAFANEAVPKWINAVKGQYGKAGPKYVCVGYCFGATYVCDELAGHLCSAGAFAHPAFLKEHHFTNLKKPLFLSCAEVDHTFDIESRNKAVDLMREHKKTYHLQLFSGVEHGFALRGNMEDTYERFVKEQSLKGINRNMGPPKAFDFTGEVAIVTGAGSRLRGEVGNGRATAILLARQGAKIALVDYNEEWAQDTKRMIDAVGGISEVIRTDVTNEESCKNAVARIVMLFGTLHILVNIVGVGGAMGDATKVDMDAWDRDFRINVTSMVLMARYAIPEMRKNGRGSIVNMSSVSGLLGGNPSLLYPTSKGAIIQMTRAMAAQHGKENIRVNCVAPGMVFTPMVRGRGITDEIRQARVDQNLMKREGTAWDVGYAIVYLASKEAKWVTGLIMPVDAGTTAGKADRPALKEDVLAEKNTGIRNSKL